MTDSQSGLSWTAMLFVTSGLEPPEQLEGRIGVVPDRRWIAGERGTKPDGRPVPFWNGVSYVVRGEVGEPESLERMIHRFGGDPLGLVELMTELADSQDPGAKVRVVLISRPTKRSHGFSLSSSEVAFLARIGASLDVVTEHWEDDT